MRNPSFVIVDGVELEIITSTKALVDTPTGQHPAADIDELLLSDERIVWRCASSRDEDCVWLSTTSASSVRAHLKAHSVKGDLRKAQADLAAAQKELQERKQRQVDGGKKAAETRKAKKAEKPAGVEQPKDLLKEIEHHFDLLSDDLDDLGIMLERVKEKLPDLKKYITEALANGTLTPEQVDKLKRYDNLKAAGLVLP